MASINDKTRKQYLDMIDAYEAKAREYRAYADESPRREDWYIETAEDLEARAARVWHVIDADDRAAVVTTPCTICDALEAHRAAAEAERAKEATREGFHYDPEAYAEAVKAADVARGLTALALKQAAASILEAVDAEADKWTAKPAHYKATAKAIEAAAAHAAACLGVSVRLGCDYGNWEYPHMRVTPNHAVFPYHAGDIEARIPCEAGHLQPFGDWATSYTAAEWRRTTAEEARRILEGYRAAMNDAEQAAKNYRDRMGDRFAHYKAFDMFDDLAKAAAVPYIY